MPKIKEVTKLNKKGVYSRIRSMKINNLSEKNKDICIKDDKIQCTNTDANNNLTKSSDEKIAHNLTDLNRENPILVSPKHSDILINTDII
jgi:hypothetical protein